MNNTNSPELNIPEGTIIAETLLHIFNYEKLSELYSFLHDKDPIFVIDSIFSQLDLEYLIPEDDLKNIPSDGAFITVSNHPYRGIDSMILYKIVAEKRKDFKILASFLLHRIEPLRDIVIPVNTHETEFVKSSYPGIKQAINHLKDGHSIGIFPTGDNTEPIKSSRVILDNIWQPAALKFIKNSHIPVIPVYFHGTNSRLIYMMGKIHPMLRQTKLPSELLHKGNRNIKVRIGSPITVKEQSGFEDIMHFGQYLRARVYSLGSAIEVKKFSMQRTRHRIFKPELIVERVPAGILREEFDRIRINYELFSSKNYSVICAPAEKIPAIFHEIGRLRELTFRKVGEGTGKSTDIDEYDFYFNHLFIWDNDTDKIVGAYRIGKGKDIIGGYGIRGFYINSLFRLKTSFQPVLSQSLELGRSFISEEYQKKTIPLFLLWKGIMVFLLRNPEYRYLIGPVSISNDFSKFSKSLIVEFIRKYFADDRYSGYIVPRKDFIVKPDKAIDRSIFIDTSENDINKIEKIITDIEPGYRLPVLLKKYLEINGRIIGFNIDPKFNYCLDGLLILDLHNVPEDYIQGLARQLNDESIIERFKAH
ncbi:MAG: lysophospholipid acyltransferase family protein [Bacteroidales bacterium]|nr:lysophospholipid acyltransferase family protein [Bacteroidales bacterium]